MKKTTKTIIIAVALVLTGAIIAAAIAIRGKNASAEEYMSLEDSEREEHARARYNEFSEHPDREFEILISFKDASTADIRALLAGEDEIISAFHCFVMPDDVFAGGYTECGGKTIDEVIDDYFASIYNLVTGQLADHDANVQLIIDSYAVGTEGDGEQGTEPDYDIDTHGKDVDMSPLPDEELPEESGEDDLAAALAEDLAYEEKLFQQLTLQKQSMDNGEFTITGIRLVMTGSEITELLNSSKVGLVEILDFANNNVLSPIQFTRQEEN